MCEFYKVCKGGAGRYRNGSASMKLRSRKRKESVNLFRPYDIRGKVRFGMRCLRSDSGMNLVDDETLHPFRWKLLS